MPGARGAGGMGYAVQSHHEISKKEIDLSKIQHEVLGGLHGNFSQPSAAIDKQHIPKIVFAITTMRRFERDGTVAPVNYLIDLVEGILSDVHSESAENLRFVIYNVDPLPEAHKQPYELARRHPNRVKVLTKYHSEKSTSLDINDAHESIKVEGGDGQVRDMSKGYFKWIVGETKDATNLLFEARKLAPYVVFLEDDVKPTSNVVNKISEYLRGMTLRGLNSWMMIDLYTPNITWGRNPLYVKNFQRYDYECCTQAMLFRSDRLMDLLVYETQHGTLPIDDNIRNYARQKPDKGKEIYAIVPNLFEHIGNYSSNPEKSSSRVEHQSIDFQP